MLSLYPKKTIMFLLIFFIQTGLYGQQKPILSIFDFQGQDVNKNVIKKLQNSFYKYFKKQDFIKLLDKNEIKKALYKFNVNSNHINENQYVKIAETLNSNLMMLCFVKKDKQIIIIHTKIIHLDINKIIIDKEIKLQKNDQSHEKLNQQLDDIISIIKNQNFTFNEENNELIKRTVMIIPFYNINNVSDYDYLNGMIRDALRTELLNTDQFLFTDFSLVDKEIKKYNLNNIIDEKKIKDLAWKLKADVAVIGKYAIIEDEIMINVTVIDIFKNQAVASSNIKGNLGIDVFRIIDQSAKDITTKMKKNIKMVNKSYFDEMMKLRNNEIIKKKQISTDDDHPKYWKRHFIDISLMGGYTGLYSHSLEISDLTGKEGHGGLIGSSFGYLYGFNNYFAFGPGITFLIALAYQRSLLEERLTISGSTCFLLQFMFGDLRKNKIAFLLDIGGFMLFSTKIGVYIKGFFFKVGYTLFNFDVFDFRYLTFGHCVTIDFGYKINFRRKIKR